MPGGRYARSGYRLLQRARKAAKTTHDLAIALLGGGHDTTLLEGVPA